MSCRNGNEMEKNAVQEKAAQKMPVKTIDYSQVLHSFWTAGLCLCCPNCQYFVKLCYFCRLCLGCCQWNEKQNEIKTSIKEDRQDYLKFN